MLSNGQNIIFGDCKQGSERVTPNTATLKKTEKN